MLRVNIDKRLELKFREIAMKRYGYVKGSLSKAIEEAILKWISSVEDEIIDFDGDPVEVLDGMLSDVKASSVDLQHEVLKVWVKE
ncbi:MAG: hypothetical protein ACP6IP_05940 [Candidatus Njordarchaeia archaeon]